mmetsp:Transcript_42212/g.109474  ORF Transcript_42212/g.109474 Transcript_42212/m.109474 type:complete len:395 (+) Transcript_42212:98-1282(+)
MRSFAWSAAGWPRSPLALALLVVSHLALRLVALPSPGEPAAPSDRPQKVGLPHAFQERVAGVDPAAYPALSAASSWVTNRDTGVNDSLPWHLPQDYMFAMKDGFPFIFPAPSNRDMLICIPQKLGSTRWNTMFRQVYDPEVSVGRRGGVHGAPAPWTLLEEYNNIDKLVAKMRDPATLRFIWVRNPYTRLLSAFLDKICGEHVKRFAGTVYPQTCDAAGFLNLLRVLNSMADRGEVVHRLFALQKYKCGLPAGMQYDYFLKVECEAEWYAEFVSITGLADTARHGWAGGASAEEVPDCFMELPGLSCQETDAHIRSLNRGPQPPPTPRRLPHPHMRGEQAHVHSDEALHALHATGSEDRMKEFYATQEVVDLATRYVRPDLDMFGYPVMAAVGL